MAETPLFSVGREQNEEEADNDRRNENCSHTGSAISCSSKRSRISLWFTSRNALKAGSTTSLTRIVAAAMLVAQWKGRATFESAIGVFFLLSDERTCRKERRECGLFFQFFCVRSVAGKIER